MMRTKLEEKIHTLYQDVFDSGNCEAVDPHYHPDVVCYFDGMQLTLDNLKAAMAKFVSLHKDIHTEVKHLLVDGNRTFARLERSATCITTNEKRTAQIMVLKEFRNEKVSKLWFMVDNEIFRNIWSEKSAYSNCTI
jgi:hypothetical protein